jgi:2-methylcitrate dehydratase PrpD
MAAELAAKGFRGPHCVLEGPFGFLAAHCEQPDIGYLFAELDTRREVERISFKIFPCCRSVHPAITATLAALDGVAVEAKDISSIELIICDEDLDLVAEPHIPKMAPKTPEEAQFSLYWGTAVAAAHGKVTPADFTAQALGSPDLIELAAKVSYRTDPQMTASRPEYYPCKASIKLYDGRLYEASVRAPRGDYRNPISDAELMAKASGLLMGLDVTREALFDAVWDLHDARDLAEFMDLITNGGMHVEEGG